MIGIVHNGRLRAPSCRTCRSSKWLSQCTWELKRLVGPTSHHILHNPSHHFILRFAHVQHQRLQVAHQFRTMASQSPPRQQTPLIQESPVRVKHVHSNPAYQSDILGDARLAVLRDLGAHAPMIPFQTFLDHLAPPQPEFDLNATMQSLKSGSEPVLTS